MLDIIIIINKINNKQLPILLSNNRHIDYNTTYTNINIYPYTLSFDIITNNNLLNPNIFEIIKLNIKHIISTRGYIVVSPHILQTLQLTFISVMEDINNNNNNNNNYINNNNNILWNISLEISEILELIRNKSIGIVNDMNTIVNPLKEVVLPLTLVQYTQLNNIIITIILNTHKKAIESIGSHNGVEVVSMIEVISKGAKWITLRESLIETSVKELQSYYPECSDLNRALGSEDGLYIYEISKKCLIDPEVLATIHMHIYVWFKSSFITPIMTNIPTLSNHPNSNHPKTTKLYISPQGPPVMVPPQNMSTLEISNPWELLNHACVLYLHRGMSLNHIKRFLITIDIYKTKENKYSLNTIELNDEFNVDTNNQRIDILIEYLHKSIFQYWRQPERTIKGSAMNLIGMFPTLQGYTKGFFNHALLPLRFNKNKIETEEIKKETEEIKKERINESRIRLISKILDDRGRSQLLQVRATHTVDDISSFVIDKFKNNEKLLNYIIIDLGNYFGKYKDIDIVRLLRDNTNLKVSYYGVDGTSKVLDNVVDKSNPGSSNNDKMLIYISYEQSTSTRILTSVYKRYTKGTITLVTMNDMISTDNLIQMFRYIIHTSSKSVNIHFTALSDTLYNNDIMCNNDDNKCDIKLNIFKYSLKVELERQRHIGTLASYENIRNITRQLLLDKLNNNIIKCFYNNVDNDNIYINLDNNNINCKKEVMCLYSKGSPLGDVDRHTVSVHTHDRHVPVNSFVTPSKRYADAYYTPLTYKNNVNMLAFVINTQYRAIEILADDVGGIDADFILKQLQFIYNDYKNIVINSGLYINTVGVISHKFHPPLYNNNIYINKKNKQINIDEEVNIDEKSYLYNPTEVEKELQSSKPISHTVTPIIERFLNINDNTSIFNKLYSSEEFNLIQNTHSFYTVITKDNNIIRGYVFSSIEMILFEPNKYNNNNNNINPICISVPITSQTVYQNNNNIIFNEILKDYQTLILLITKEYFILDQPHWQPILKIFLLKYKSLYNSIHDYYIKDNNINKITTSPTINIIKSGINRPALLNITYNEQKAHDAYWKRLLFYSSNYTKTQDITTTIPPIDPISLTHVSEHIEAIPDDDKDYNKLVFDPYLYDTNDPNSTSPTHTPHESPTIPHTTPETPREPPPPSPPTPGPHEGDTSSNSSGSSSNSSGSSSKSTRGDSILYAKYVKFLLIAVVGVFLTIGAVIRRQIPVYGSNP
eukprot:GHVR01010781.1.p1 GENE.GHVR01010781.1~~GHVR01010781.1.p1  ORF type:complete len:1251 (-),score=407.38 GHVR01010781.1:88-3753(-)